MICTDKLPKFCIEGVKLYINELERKKNGIISERNGLALRYCNFCKNSHNHFTMHNQTTEIDKQELGKLEKIIHEHFNREFEKDIAEVDNEIALVKKWLQREEAKLEEDDD